MPIILTDAVRHAHEVLDEILRGIDGSQVDQIVQDAQDLLDAMLQVDYSEERRKAEEELDLAADCE